MACKNKILVLLFLVLLTAPIIAIVKPANAQLAPKPTIPQFTLKFIDNSTDIPPTTISTTDPYTNKVTNKTIPGYHVNNTIIELSITNQAYTYTNGSIFHLFYDIRTKPHFSNDWIDLHPNYVESRLTGVETSGPTYGSFIRGLEPQPNTGYTIITFSANDYEPDAQIDFQVQAILGHDSQILVPNFSDLPYRGGNYIPAIAFDGTSDWSTTQTITIPSTIPSPSPQQNGISIILITALITVIVLIVAAISQLLYRKNQKTAKLESD